MRISNFRHFHIPQLKQELSHVTFMSLPTLGFDVEDVETLEFKIKFVIYSMDPTEKPTGVIYLDLFKVRHSSKTGLRTRFSWS